jgi:hypothetical protein
MDFKAYVQSQLQFTHGTMEQVVADLGEGLNDKPASGTIGSPAAIYAHAVMAEDFIVNGMIMGGAPLFVSGGWAQKTGVPASATGPRQTPEWAASVNMNLAPFREYAAAVYANTSKVVAEMSESKAAEVIDTPFGSKQPRLEFLANLGVTHAWGHMGEIAALKGVKGLKGLPF